MQFDAGSAFSEGWDRITTQVAILLVGLYAAASIVQTAAIQDITREGILELREFMQDELSAEEYQDFVDETEPIVNDLPLALGLDLVPALVLLLVALLASTAVVALAIDAFARRAADVDELDTSGLVLHTLNIFVGGIVYFVLIMIGFALLFVPGIVVLVIFAFYPAAIVVEDENFVSAFGSSFGTVTDNVGHTLLLLLLAIVISVAGSVLSTVATALLSGTIGAIVSTTVTAAVTILIVAMLTRAYVAAHPDAPRADADETGANETGADAL